MRRNNDRFKQGFEQAQFKGASRSEVRRTLEKAYEQANFQPHVLLGEIAGIFDTHAGEGDDPELVRAAAAIRKLAEHL
jgi:hypothetical protein